MLSVCLLFSLLLLGVIQRGHNAGNAKIEKCSDVGQISLIDGRVSVNRGTVRGQIEICSNHSNTVLSWESLCDDNWTVEDVTVACRDLGYSVFNATRFFPDIHGKVQSGYAYDCSGSESRLADCRSHLTENCNSSIGVQCYNAASTTVSLITSSTTVCPLTSRTAVTLGISNTITANTTPALTRLQPSIYVQATSTGQLFTPSPLLQATPPTKNQIYIYATVGTVTVLLLAIVAIVIVAIILCNRSARKQVTSPQFAQNNDHVPAPDGNTDQTVMEQTNKITQDNINYEVVPPAVHVYEDVKPNKQNAQAWYEQEEDYTSLDRSTSLEPHHNSDSTGNRESITMQQQHSYSCLNHKEPPPVKGKPCVPQAVNQLSFLMSPTKTNFEDSTDDRFPSDSIKQNLY